jgi:predicted MPP superfamily phosphohydrolase
MALALLHSGKRRYCYKEIKINKLAVALAALILLVGGGYSLLSRDFWMTQPYINSRPNIANSNSKIEYDDNTGVYTITKTTNDFKILQLTDIHLGGGPVSYHRDLQALSAIYKLIDHTRPDFVVVTGDLTFPVGYSSFSFNNTAPVQQFASFMRNLGIPWAFAYGNHDTETYAATTEQDVIEVYKSLSYKSSKTLLYPYVQPDITGRNNQLIELRNADGSLNQAIIILDSNSYTGEGFNKYDYIHDDQVAWYKHQIEKLSEEEGYTVPSLVFFHIPLREYVTAYDLYREGSDEVDYYFGENNDEVMDVSEYESKLFDTAVKLGSTKAMFCGHDHYNNTSIEYQGIRLTYGMSIDYLAMPGIARDTKQRGATLITTHKDSSFDIEQIPLTSIEHLYPQNDWLEL